MKLTIGVMGSAVGTFENDQMQAQNVTKELFDAGSNGFLSGNPITRICHHRFLYDGPPRLVLPPAQDPNNLTIAEKLARYEHWRQFVAVAGV